LKEEPSCRLEQIKPTNPGTFVSKLFCEILD
jgi:hypothetical protein